MVVMRIAKALGRLACLLLLARRCSYMSLARTTCLVGDGDGVAIMMISAALGFDAVRMRNRIV